MPRLSIALAALFAAAPASAVTDAHVERIDATHVSVTWADRGPVRVFVTTDPQAGIAGLTPVATAVRTVTLPSDTDVRRYFLLKGGDGTITRVAERVVPLASGSNFRDIGGYAAADGRHVRWGMIYRSGATPLLTADDVARVKALGLREMVDLRSSEERVLAPTRLTGIRYTAIDYSMMTMMGDRGALKNGVDMYRRFPTFFAPQLRIVFDDLLRRQEPLLYHCTAGQDRTGFTTAMILSALGVPRATIIADYHLSTTYRRPANEWPPIDEATARINPVAAMIAGYQKGPGGRVAQPLKEADGTPYLAGAFAEIEARWGSVDDYLEREIGVSKAQLGLLRAIYLE